jgi:hypothetical protein
MTVSGAKRTIAQLRKQRYGGVLDKLGYGRYAQKLRTAMAIAAKVG